MVEFVFAASEDAIFVHVVVSAKSVWLTHDIILNAINFLDV